MTVPEQHDEAVQQRRQPGPEGHRNVQQRIRGNRRSLELTGLIIVLFAINLFWNSHTANNVQQAATRAISTACDFWYPLTTLPVTIVTGQSKPTELSVHIIAGARESYQGQCLNDDHPPLPPPSPSLVRWAGYYHITVAR